MQNAKKSFQKYILSSQTGIAQVLILLLLLTGIGIGTYLVQNRTNLTPKAQTTFTPTCQTSDNLVKDCGFEGSLKTVSPFQVTNILGGWIDSSKLKPGQFTNHLLKTQESQNNSYSMAIGSTDSAICTNSKNYNGADAKGGNYSLFPEIRQYIDLKDKTSIDIEFSFKMQSEGTTPGSAPFYVYIANEIPPYPGKEIYLAYATQNNSCGSGQIAGSYTCKVNGGTDQNCSGINSSWKKVSFSLSETDLKNIGIFGKQVYIGFGVTNNYPTIVYLDDVKITATQANVCRDNPFDPPTVSDDEDFKYLWKADCTSETSQKCQTNSDCPKNLSDPKVINPETSAACHQFLEGKRCIQLTKIDNESKKSLISEKEGIKLPFGFVKLGKQDNITNIRKQTDIAFANYKSFNEILEQIEKNYSQIDTSRASGLVKKGEAEANACLQEN